MRWNGLEWINVNVDVNVIVIVGGKEKIKGLAIL